LAISFCATAIHFSAFVIEDVCITVQRHGDDTGFLTGRSAVCRPPNGASAAPAIR
jgi:hypothetical protein